MSRDLLYYRAERDLENYHIQVSDADGQIIFDNLKKKYKFQHTLNYRGVLGGGRCRNFTITLSHTPYLGVIAHEVAHALQFKKWGYAKPRGIRFHTKKHRALLEKVLLVIVKNKDAWIAKEKARGEKQLQASILKEKRQKEVETFKRTDIYKIEMLKIRERILVRRQKIINTLLKKTQRKLKYYENKKVKQ